MLEKRLAAEVLEVRILHPAIAQSLVGKVVGVLEDRQPRHQPRRQRRLARLVGIDRPKRLLQKTHKSLWRAYGATHYRAGQTYRQCEGMARHVQGTASRFGNSHLA